MIERNQQKDTVGWTNKAKQTKKVRKKVFTIPQQPRCLERIRKKMA